MSLRKEMKWKQKMKLIQVENNHRQIKTLEEIEILKEASFKYLLDVKSVIWTSTVNCPSQETEEISTPYKICWECRINDESPYR